LKNFELQNIFFCHSRADGNPVFKRLKTGNDLPPEAGRHNLYSVFASECEANHLFKYWIATSEYLLAMTNEKRIL
jgi:hypothetical protein